MMNEKRDFRLQRNTHPLTPEKLAQILRRVTVEKDAAETYERLTGEEIPDAEREKNTHIIIDTTAREVKNES